jgi:hypothetical protein
MQLNGISKKAWIVLILVLILALLGFLFYSKKHRSDQETAEKYNLIRFGGTVVNATADGRITAKGTYVAKDVPAELAGNQSLTFKVDSATVFKKTVITFAPPKGSEQSFSISQLPHRTEDGSLDDIERNFSNINLIVGAEFTSSIYKQDQPTASVVNYTIMETPALPETGEEE